MLGLALHSENVLRKEQLHKEINNKESEDEIQTNNEYIKLIIRQLKQYVVVRDDCAFLNISPFSGSISYVWDGYNIETQAAYMRLLAAVNPEDPMIYKIVHYIIENRTHGTWWNSTNDTAFCLESLLDVFQSHL